MNVIAPPATGVRHHWADLPSPVRDAVEDILGGRVVEARSQSGGFSPGVAARVRLADGRRAFVKAVSAETNAASPDLHRAEARHTAALPPVIPRPGCSVRTTTAPGSPSSSRTSTAASPASPGTPPSWTGS